MELLLLMSKAMTLRDVLLMVALALRCKRDDVVLPREMKRGINSVMIKLNQVV